MPSNQVGFSSFLFVLHTLQRVTGKSLVCHLATFRFNPTEPYIKSNRNRFLTLHQMDFTRCIRFSLSSCSFHEFHHRIALLIWLFINMQSDLRSPPLFRSDLDNRIYE